MAERPNIVVFLTDDHAQWASGCYGNRELRTPTLDHLAQTGVRMANAFTPTPVCSPARASFWTGRLPSQHGIHDWLREGEPGIGDRDWMKDERTLAQVLSEAGYQTAFSGKWHCGRGDQVQPGFDFYFSQARATGRSFEPFFFSDQGKSVEITGYKTLITTDQAIRFLRQRDPQRPFFLFIGYTATHSPWTGHPERLVKQYRSARFDDIPADETYPHGRLAAEGLIKGHVVRELQAQYYAAVSEIDEQAGRVLDELNGQGLREKTLVVYTADHGLNCGHHGLWGKGNATRPLNMLEESIRVPLIFNHPGALFKGQVRREFVNHCDTFQTLLEYAGAAPDGKEREARRYPGRSFEPLLRGCALRDWRKEIFGEYGNLRMVRGARHKLVRRYPGGPCELFDLERDPRETVNRFDDPGERERVAALTARLEKYFAQYEDPAKSGLRVTELPRHNVAEAWRDKPE